MPATLNPTLQLANGKQQLLLLWSARLPKICPAPELDGNQTEISRSQDRFLPNLLTVFARENAPCLAGKMTNAERASQDRGHSKMSERRPHYQSSEHDDSPVDYLIRIASLEALWHRCLEVRRSPNSRALLFYMPLLCTHVR